ncbi:MAG: SH3 domain-containing protein [Oscillatoriaceae bacterium SKW80]|nr:SH3 domain-containing protein [Oscillatoriaceae bacterium SKYG93]MCX8119332.1 SH3 domain-containing protein [Oscillatoriaceae bacterium SKW80]MDW8454799.1 SH3 domain-containing protein [Oscillatoriaceae cyanobacterium SKYGB_i_bin93]HIK28420.1 SH3 domain-containing protein [Oscillatoriaceae cyanobacterium M7585_C2015_266]
MSIKNLIVAALATTTVVFSAATATQAQTNPFPGLDSYCEATLRGKQRDARINVREGAGLNYRVLHYGISGDRVMLLRETANGDPEKLAVRTDKQGYNWYRVGFPKTRATGWVRGDLLEPECFN